MRWCKWCHVRVALISKSTALRLWRLRKRTILLIFSKHPSSAKGVSNGLIEAEMEEEGQPVAHQRLCKSSNIIKCVSVPVSTRRLAYAWLKGWHGRQPKSTRAYACSARPICGITRNDACRAFEASGAVSEARLQRYDCGLTILWT